MEDKDSLLSDLGIAGAALDAATCGIVITRHDLDHPIVYMNAAFERITGYSLHEVRGRNCRFLNQGLSDADDRANEEPLERIRVALRRGAPCEATLRNRRNGGAIFWNTLRLSPIRDASGGVTHFIGVQEDVTRAVEDRQAVVDVRDQFHAVLAAAPDAIMTVDAEQRIATVNLAAERLFGWEAEEIVGQPLERLIPSRYRGLHANLAARFLGDECAKAGPMNGLRIVQTCRKDGSGFPAHVSLARYVRSGRPAVIVVAHDMSEVVGAQQALRKMSEDLAEQLKAAEAANEAKKQFLAVMNHEIRTPLNGIMGMSQLLRMTEVDDTQKKYLDAIHECGLSLLKIIEDILDVTRIDSGSLRIEPARVELSAVLNEAVMTVAADAVAKKIEIVVEFDRASVEVPLWTDGSRVKQVLCNLLANALKFSDVGPIVVRAHADRDLTEFRVEVSDRGIGVPAEKRELIFERFRQADQGMSRRFGGVGLGLSICREIVTALGGSIALEPTEGPGSTFWFTLPIRNAL